MRKWVGACMGTWRGPRRNRIGYEYVPSENSGMWRGRAAMYVSRLVRRSVDNDSALCGVCVQHLES